MAFTLKKVINGEERLFSSQNFLEIIGDVTNDEIKIHGEAYRISSYVSQESGSGATLIYEWKVIVLPVSQLGQQALTLPELIVETKRAQLIINGVCYPYGTENTYHIELNTLFWHGGFGLEPADNIYLKYIKVI